MSTASFEWDVEKDLENQAKHGVSFAQAQYAFADPQRDIADDFSHNQTELTILLFRVRGGRDSHGPIYIPSGDHTHLRRWLLAERQANL
jgi:uncharacterized DUF497 family protein